MLAPVAKVSNLKVSYSSNLKISSPKQMSQRLPIALAQVKAGNKFENLLTKIKQIIYSLYREKEVAKKSVQQYNGFNKIVKQNGTILMNSEKSKTSYPHRLLLNLSDKINLKRSDKYVALSNRSTYYTWKNIKVLER